MTPKPLAVAQLLRLPNAFTAVADIALGALAAGALAAAPWSAALLALASACLYLSGMGFNDFFDRVADARTQPFRPIPSGRVTPRFAATLSGTLMVVGVVVALAVTATNSPEGTVPPVAVAAVLAGVITLYNAWLKHTPVGPAAMGACRALNVGLGLSAGVPDATLATALMLTVGVYIAGVTLFARTEETTSDRRPLWLALAIVGAAGLAAAALPLVRPEAVPRLYPYLLAAWAAWVAGPAARALRSPSPRLVQAAVKRLIFGLVPLDAVLAAGTGGLAGLAILLLLVPATLLGRRVYST